MSVWGRRSDTAVFWLFVVALAWLPLYLGSDRLLAWGVNAVLFPGLAALFEISLLARGRQHPVPIGNLALPAGLLAAVIVWIQVQVIAWPHSPLAHPIWGMTADALGTPLAGSISVDPDATNLALLRLITASAVFWTALQMCRDARRAVLLVTSIAVIICAYSVYGLLEMRLPGLHLPWMRQTAPGLVYATFRNRNHFATYAGLGLVTIAGFLLHRYREQVRRGSRRWQSAVAAAIETIGYRGSWLAALGVLIIAALLLSGSRGGAFAAGVGLFALFLLNPERGRSSRFRLWVLIGGSAIAAAILLVVYGDPVVEGFRERGISDASRLSVYALTARSIFDQPLLGHGYGTFADIFPVYRDRSISVWGTWLQAHNTYLEIFQGLGLIFGSLLLTSVGLLLWRCIRAASAGQENAAIPAIAAAAGVLVGVHALVDFSLQIQAVALTFAALLGAGFAQTERSRVLGHR